MFTVIITIIFLVLLVFLFSRKENYVNTKYTIQKRYMMPSIYRRVDFGKYVN